LFAHLNVTCSSTCHEVFSAVTVGRASSFHGVMECPDMSGMAPSKCEGNREGAGTTRP
jgi:hypothetical protein